MTRASILLALLLTWLKPVANPLVAVDRQSPPAVVHAVLFFSPTCGHCHLVITEVLPPLFEKYGDQLYIVGVDVTQSGGDELFRTALQYFNLESGGVPFLVVGDTYLIGSAEIPEKFPGMIEQLLAQGGVGWPEIPGLVEALVPARSADAENAPSPDESDPVITNSDPGLSSEQSMGLMAKFNQDIPGNSLAVLVLVGMLVVMGWAVLTLWSSPRAGSQDIHPILSSPWLIPLLSLVGLGVAGYLAYVETSQVQAVCGPVGDCNTVQQSQYARLFSILPVGILGLIGYGMILLAWIIGRFADQRLAPYSSLALLSMSAIGLLFSIYLTFLEPFVIGATCAWCLTSAVITTALFLLSLRPARQALPDVQRRIRPLTEPGQKP